MPAASLFDWPRISACSAATRPRAEIKALDQAARAQLRKYGVRFGAFNVYIPALLKPAAADLLLLLWSLHSGRDHGLDSDALPARPQQGLTSVEAGTQIPEPYWRAAGFHVAGTRAVRIDMLERLVGSHPCARRLPRWRKGARQRHPGATGDGGFRVVPELMSVVGCSGEEFASILKALGFRRERRQLRLRPVLAEARGRDAVAGRQAESRRGSRRASTRSGVQAKRKDGRHDKQRRP